MQNIAISSLIICMNFMIASTLDQHYQIMPHLRVVYNLKESLKHKEYNWAPYLSQSNYSSTVPLNISRIDISSNLTALGELDSSGETSKIIYQFLNPYPGGTNATSAGNPSMRASSTTDGKLNSAEAPKSYFLLKEESSITFSTITGSRIGGSQIRHNRSNFLPSNNNNRNHIIIKPNISFASNSFVLERVPSSKLAAKFPEYSRLKRNDVHLREKRAVESSANFCHSLHLHKCGEPVIQKFKLELDAATKCKIREDFLDCMVRQRKEGCFSSNDPVYTDENTDLLRSKIKSHLWSAHGCLLV